MRVTGTVTRAASSRPLRRSLPRTTLRRAAASGLLRLLGRRRLALLADAFEENARGLVGRILRDELAGEGVGEEGLAEAGGAGAGRFDRDFRSGLSREHSIDRLDYPQLLGYRRECDMRVPDLLEAEMRAPLAIDELIELSLAVLRRHQKSAKKPTELRIDGAQQSDALTHEVVGEGMRDTAYIACIGADDRHEYILGLYATPLNAGIVGRRINELPGRQIQPMRPHVLSQDEDA